MAATIGEAHRGAATVRSLVAQLKVFGLGHRHSPPPRIVTVSSPLSLYRHPPLLYCHPSRCIGKVFGMGKASLARLASGVADVMELQQQCERRSQIREQSLLGQMLDALHVSVSAASEAKQLQAPPCCSTCLSIHRVSLL